MSSPHLARNLAPLEPFMGEAKRAVYRANGQTFSTPLRRALWEAHEGRCTYCGELVEFGAMHVDHVVPTSQGGDNHVSNLVLSCAYCNCAKGSRPLESLRWALRVRFSHLSGVILPRQAEELTALGIDLKLSPFPFHFEGLLEAAQ